MITYKQEVLMHHGVKGQKWGVRRYRNADGSLTKAGRKRYGVLQKASREAYSQYDHDRGTAKYYRESADEVARRYGGKDGAKKWLEDMYGSDYKDTEYMRKVFEVDDVEKHGAEGAKAQISEARSNNNRMASYYDKKANEWLNKSKALSSISVSDIDKAEYKEAKKLAKAWINEKYEAAYLNDLLMEYDRVIGQGKKK